MHFVRNQLVLLVFVSLISIGLFLYSFYPSSLGEDLSPPEPAAREIETPRPPEIERTEDIFPARSTVQDVLLGFGFRPQEVHDLIQEVRPVYNLHRVLAGNRFALEKFAREGFKSFEYQIDDEEYLLVEYDFGRYFASRQRVEFDVAVEEIFGEIETSLWHTLTSEGENPTLVFLLHRILKWDVDFTTIQRGEWFKLVLEKKYLGNEFVKYGDIAAVEFNSGGRTFYAFLFENPGDGEKHYYDEKGNAVRKAFLKVPFDIDPRITSGFSYSRYHPILKRRQPHLGVDYAAPRGGPVLAAGAGAVVFAGWDGGHGRFVKIRHPNGYLTGYAHLWRIDVRAGEKVKQGQRIGSVGSTGLSTGPHLHYVVQRPNGQPVSPREVSVLPSDKPVEKRYWEEFVSVRDRLLNHLASISRPQPALNSVQAD